MSTIGQRVFVAGGNQLYMTLGNEEYVRTLGIGTNWTKLRIGILIAQTPDGTNNIAGSSLVIGFCSGTTNPYGAALTTNFVGASYPNFTDTPSPLVYTANAGLPFFAGGGQTQNSFKKVGATVTHGGAMVAPTIVTNTGSTQRRSAVYLDITKGSPNYTIGAFSPNAAIANVDCPFSSFLDGLESLTPVIQSVTYGAVATGAVATSEAAGVFDTLDLFWNKSAFPVEIYSIAVYRML